MGQKVHPIGFRLGFNKTWRSRWYAEKDYANLLHEDIKLKKELKKRFAHAGVSHVDIERAANKLKVSIFTSRPGIIIGRKGQEVDKLKQEIQKKTGKEVFINIQEILKPELDAQLVSESVAKDIEKALRSAIANAVNVADKNQKRRLDEDDLVVSACYADQGPSQKRVRPAPMGRAYQVIKRTAHLTVCVAEKESK